MDLSIFLAQLIGLYFIILGVILAIRKSDLIPVFNEVLRNRGFVVVFGIINLVIGLAIVIGHNVWIASWPVIITILGYYTLIKGVFELTFPDHFTRMSSSFLEPAPYWFSVIVLLVLGIVLTYYGFAGVGV